MTNQTNNNQCRDDEIVILTHWDKKEERWVKSIFPKEGGRLDHSGSGVADSWHMSMSMERTSTWNWSGSD